MVSLHSFWAAEFPGALTWCSCFLPNAWLTAFPSLWLSFSILTVKLESGLGRLQRSQRKQHLRGWYRVGSAESPGQTERPFASGSTGSSLAFNELVLSRPQAQGEHRLRAN